MARRSDIDWEAIQRDYRLGTDSIASVAKKHGVAVSGLKKKAKELGWVRDLTPVVQLATQTGITQERADHAKELAEAAPEIGREIGRQIAKSANSGLDQDVAAAAALGVYRNRIHADVADALILTGQSMMAEIQALGNPELQDILLNGLDPDDDRTREKVRRITSVSERVKNLDTLAATFTKAIALDRKANGLDDKETNGGKGIEDVLDGVWQRIQG